MAVFWRIRMKVGGHTERSTEAWDRAVVGAWYGAWTADEWAQANISHPDNLWSFLGNLPHQRQLEWSSVPDFGAIRRLEAIGPDDWIVVFLRDRGQIGLARVDAELRSEPDHPLNHRYECGSSEVFKFRRLVARKVFTISDLPDAYLLLPTQGRGNIHRIIGMRSHVQLLADHPDACSLRQAVASMKLDEFVDLLGASAWESVCTAYLTLEHGFVPTGLRTGSTLPVFDIVGRSTPSGTHIVAQCKKSPSPVAVAEDFISAVGQYTGSIMAFYFAFSGTSGSVPANVQVIGREEILTWAQAGNGAMYRRFLLGT